MLKDLIELRQETALWELAKSVKKPSDITDEDWQQELDKRKDWLMQFAKKARSTFPVVIKKEDQQTIEGWFANDQEKKTQFQFLQRTAWELLHDVGSITSPFEYESNATDTKRLSSTAAQALMPELQAYQQKIDAYFTNLENTNLKNEARRLNEDFVWLHFPIQFTPKEFSARLPTQLESEEWNVLSAEYLANYSPTLSKEALDSAKKTYLKLIELLDLRKKYLNATDIEVKKGRLAARGVIPPSQILDNLNGAYTKHKFNLSSLKKNIRSFEHAYESYLLSSGSPKDEAKKELQLLNLYIDLQVQISAELRKQRGNIVSSDGFSHLKITGNDSLLFKALTNSITVAANFSHNPDSINEQLTIDAKLGKPTANKFCEGFYGDVVRVGAGEQTVTIIKHPNTVIDLSKLFKDAMQLPGFKQLYTDKSNTAPSVLGEVNDQEGRDFLCVEVLKHVSQDEGTRRNITFTCTQSFEEPIQAALFKLLTLHGLNIFVNSEDYHYTKNIQEFEDHCEITELITTTKVVVGYAHRGLTITNSSGSQQEILEEGFPVVRQELKPGLFAKINYKIYKPSALNSLPRLEDFEVDIATTKLPGGCSFQIVPTYLDNASNITSGMSDLLFPYRRQLCTFLKVPHDTNYISRIDENQAHRSGVLNWFVESPLPSSEINPVESLMRRYVYSGKCDWTGLANELIQFSKKKLASLSPDDHQTRLRYQILAQMGYDLKLDVIFYDLADAKKAKDIEQIAALKIKANLALKDTCKAYTSNVIPCDSTIVKKLNHVLDEFSIPSVNEDQKSNNEWLTLADRILNEVASRIRASNPHKTPHSEKKQQEELVKYSFELYLKAANDFITAKNAELSRFTTQLQKDEAELQQLRQVSPATVPKEAETHASQQAELQEKIKQGKEAQRGILAVLADEKRKIILKLVTEINNECHRESIEAVDSPALHLMKTLGSTLLSFTPNNNDDQDFIYMRAGYILFEAAASRLENEKNNSLPHRKYFCSLMQLGLGFSLDSYNIQMSNQYVDNKDVIDPVGQLLTSAESILLNSAFEIDKNLTKRFYLAARTLASRGASDVAATFAKNLLKNITTTSESIYKDPHSEVNHAQMEKLIQISYGMQLEILFEKLKRAVNYKEVQGQEFNVVSAICESTNPDNSDTSLLQELKEILGNLFNFVAQSYQSVDARLQQLMRESAEVLLLDLSNDSKKPVEEFLQGVINKMQGGQSFDVSQKTLTATNSLSRSSEKGKSASNNAVSLSPALPVSLVAASPHPHSELLPPTSIIGTSASPSATSRFSSSFSNEPSPTSTQLSTSSQTEFVELIMREDVPAANPAPSISEKLLEYTELKNGRIKLKNNYLSNHAHYLDKLISDVQLNPYYMLGEVTEQLSKSSPDTVETHNTFTKLYFAALVTYLSCENNAELNVPCEELQKILVKQLPNIASEDEMTQATTLRAHIEKLLNSNDETSSEKLARNIEYIQNIARMKYAFKYDVKPLALAAGAANLKYSLEKARTELRNNNSSILENHLKVLVEKINALPFSTLSTTIQYDLLTDLVDSASLLIEHKKEHISFEDMQSVVAIYNKVASLKKSDQKSYSPSRVARTKHLYQLMGEYVECHLSPTNNTPLENDTCNALKLVIDLEPRRFVTSKKVSFTRLLNLYSDKNPLSRVDVVPQNEQAAQPVVSSSAAVVANSPVVPVVANPLRSVVSNNINVRTSSKTIINLGLDTLKNRKHNNACRTEILELLNKKDPHDDEQGIAAKSVQTYLGNNNQGYARVEALLSDANIVTQLNASEIADLLRPHPKLIKKVIAGGGFFSNLFGNYQFNPVREKLGSAELSSLLHTIYMSEAPSVEAPNKLTSKQRKALKLAKEHIIAPSLWERAVTFMFGGRIHEKFNSTEDILKLQNALVYRSTDEYNDAFNVSPIKVEPLSSIVPTLVINPSPAASNHAPPVSSPVSVTPILPEKDTVELALTLQKPTLTKEESEELKRKIAEQLPHGNSATILRALTPSSPQAEGVEVLPNGRLKRSNSDEMPRVPVPSTTENRDPSPDSKSSSTGSTPRSRTSDSQSPGSRTPPIFTELDTAADKVNDILSTPVPQVPIPPAITVTPPPEEEPIPGAQQLPSHRVSG